MSWKMTSRAVNSKRLMDEIHEFVTVGIDETGVNWGSDVQRGAFIEMLTEAMTEEFLFNDRIEQFDIRCDARNNKAADMVNGKFVLDVLYKQRHCLNTTHLRYDISEDEFELDFDIQF